MISERKYEQVPLVEIIQARKKYYEDMTHQLIETAYKIGDFNLIGEIEQNIMRLSSKLEGKLEQISLETISKEQKPVKKTKKPLLDYEEYIMSKENNLTNEQIIGKYQLENKNQLRGFAAQYARIKRSSDKPVISYALYQKFREQEMSDDEIKNKYKPLKPEEYFQRYDKEKEPVTLDTRNLLTYKIYEAEKDRRCTNDQIKQNYKLKSNHQMGGFARKYVETLKKREQESSKNNSD